MGGVAGKCSDVTMDKSAGALKPLDASSSEESDDEDEEEDSDDEDEDDDAEDTKNDAEAALNDGLKRGRTATFKQLIHHSRDIGVDESKIMKAEQMLKTHKEARRRELFETELREFLEGEEAEDLNNCTEYEKKGIEYGAKEQLMDQLRGKISDLNLRKQLNNEEVAEAKLWLEVQTRSFVKSAVLGRSTVWVDIESGKKLRALVVLDLIVKNFSIQKAAGNDELASCGVTEVVPKRASTIDEFANSDTFLELSEMDQDNSVAWVRPDGSYWIFIEESNLKVDEALAAITVLSGAGLKAGKVAENGKGQKKKMPKLSPGSPDAGGPDLSPITPRAAKMKESEENEDEAPPQSAREKKDKKDKKEKKEEKGEKKEKKDKEEKKDKKDKKDKKSKKDD